MRTVVVTDGKYRSAIAAVRTFGRAGYRVIVTQTRGDVSAAPPVFSSRYVSACRWLEGKCKDSDYPARLMALLREYDCPVLFCVGADSLAALSRHRDAFADVCRFLVAPPQVLDAVNDKAAVHAACRKLAIPVPAQYDAAPERYPVIIKPHCGEKLGLKAAQRYVCAATEAEFRERYAAMQVYDPQPLVQEKITGAGQGACLLLDSEGRLISALCHRRLREYPIAGGPSTCCVSFYDAALIERAYRLLSSFGFVGMAMVEFKGDYVLEVNPRVWGSFPMTACAQSPFVLNYASAACGETVDYTPQDYRTGVKMRFMLNDACAMLSYLRAGRVGPFFSGLADIFRAKEALAAADDMRPLWVYLKNTLLRK